MVRGAARRALRHRCRPAPDVCWFWAAVARDTDLVNVIEVFLPQLLTYPNPTDPLNGEAAALLLRDPQGYQNKVKGTKGNAGA